MSKAKKGDYLCKCCGFEGTKNQLIKHCNKEHKHEPEILFDMIGEFGSLEAAKIAYKKVTMDMRTYNTLLSQYKTELKKKDAEISRLANAVNAYNEACSSVTHTFNLLSTSLEPVRVPKENGS